jgi:hypothetical protein
MGLLGRVFGGVPLTFTVIDHACTGLWDFGWFDLTHFRVDGFLDPPPGWREIFVEFLRAPIFEYSLCSPEPWGEGGLGRHGPAVLAAFLSSWILPLSAGDLAKRVRSILDDPEFTTPPTPEQRGSVDAWIADTVRDGDDAFLLDIPASAREEWASAVWTIYNEFLLLSPDRRVLTVAVFGYD